METEVLKDEFGEEFIGFRSDRVVWKRRACVDISKTDELVSEVTELCGNDV